MKDAGTHLEMTKTEWDAKPQEFRGITKRATLRSLPEPQDRSDRIVAREDRRGRPRPGDIVNILGCHIRYRPTLVRFDGNQAVLRSLSGEHRWPASKVKQAAPIPAKKRASPDQEYD